MKVNLGCGRFKIEGFVNVDAVQNDEVKPDVLKDARLFLAGLERETVDFIYAGHFIEHLDANETNLLLREAHRVLVRGGKIQIVVPDIEKAVNLLKQDRLGMPIDDVVFGDRSNKFEHHKQVFTKNILLAKCNWHFEDAKEIHTSPYWVANVGWQTTVECKKQ